MLTGLTGIKKLWERIDGRIGFITGLITGLILGLAAYGILLLLKEWIANNWLWSKLFGWIFKIFQGGAGL